MGPTLVAVLVWLCTLFALLHSVQHGILTKCTSHASVLNAGDGVVLNCGEYTAFRPTRQVFRTAEWIQFTCCTSGPTAAFDAMQIEPVGPHAGEKTTVCVVPLYYVTQYKYADCCVMGAQSIYTLYAGPDGKMTLQHFIIIFGGVQLVLSQLPTIHTLRGLNVACTLCTIGFTITCVAMCIKNVEHTLYHLCLSTQTNFATSISISIRSARRAFQSH
jgi:hypothetical protein